MPPASLNLTAEQQEALAQVARATMEASAEVLSDLVLRTVRAGAPDMSAAVWEELTAGLKEPLLTVRVEYVSGVTGSNLLLMGAQDARVISSLMMGEEPNAEVELDELHMSALGEAMNQMMGSVATALSDLLGRRIEISPPVVQLRPLAGADIASVDPLLAQQAQEGLAVLTFPLQIEDDVANPIQSRVLQIFPEAFARRLAEEFLARRAGARAGAERASADVAKEAPRGSQKPAEQSRQGAAARQAADTPGPGAAQRQGRGPGSASRAGASRPEPGAVPGPWQAPELDAEEEQVEEEHVPLEIIKRITVPVTVRLGQAYLPLEDVLSLSRGSIVPLDVSDGQPVDVLVSGTLVARGEVVVVKEHFGVRITELVRPEGPGA